MSCSIFFLVINSRAIASDDICAYSSLPQAVERLLVTKYPDWNAWKLPDESPYLEKWTKEHSKNCPGIASGYFESRTQLSHAILLVPKDPEKLGYRLVVLSKWKASGQDTYRERILWEDDSELARKVVYGYIYTVPPGTYWDFDKTRNVQIGMEGFVYRLIVGRQTILFYWHQDKYADITIGE